MTSNIIVYMPAFNEGETIFKVLNSINIKRTNVNVEYLVVDDGSTDNTVIEAKKANATVVSHRYNKGVGKAFETAIEYALNNKVDVLVSIDADGQFDVNQIDEFLNTILDDQADFCIGNRFSKSKPEKMPFAKYWGNKQMNKIISFIGKEKIEDASCGFRAYSKKALLNLNLQGQFTYTHEVILDLLDKGFRVNQIPVNVIYFEDRVSRIANNLFSYAFRSLMIIFKCYKDYKPLNFFLSIASLVLLTSLAGGFFVLYNWFTVGSISPYKSIGIISLALLGISILLTIFAFLADMLNRIRRNQEKILYLSKQKYFDKN
ncbi:glycosyltransferase family 2 protein [Psychroflexus sp. CAK1W]|uniref:glycosyltransferase family 2 protein n=1 Tax=Psychroflexus curvus TaxID=2873595 RepID=UPI001CCE51DF|nr:glycosyltransferase family 2 protein [Psychroflexus curvus]MBZ9628918.1 glycosyltransferase family 2 protein [Psychroflexus curvus]